MIMILFHIVVPVFWYFTNKLEISVGLTSENRAYLKCTYNSTFQIR